MKPSHTFVQTLDDLTRSTIEFHDKWEYWKPALGSVPKYFVHLHDGEKNIFGLSKFCAFQDILVEDYISNYRYKTDGGTTQKHIAWLTGQKWMPRRKLDKIIRQSFDDWISEFFPNYNLDNASFISLTITEKPQRKRRKFVSPEYLQDKLKLQAEIGQVGEDIALQFEIQRLKEKGVRNVNQHVDHVSKKNSAAGYDIYSSAKKETRYIEVKSSLNDGSDFFITENEVKTLEALGNEAYVYLVHVTDLSKKVGQVIKVVNDPIKQLTETGKLTPIAYKAEF